MQKFYPRDDSDPIKNAEKDILSHKNLKFSDL